MVFIGTDKPIYKPGQIVRIRLIAVDSMLKKTEDDVTVEILDAKNLHIDGMAEIEFPLSNEPNEGIWKVRVLRNGKTIDQLDFGVERYVLPKYEVRLLRKIGFCPMRR